MNPKNPVAVCLALGLSAFVVPQVSKVDPNSSRTMASDLVAALNTKDEAKLRSFVQKWVIPNAPIDQRVKRWKELAVFGAPFKIVREYSETAEQAIVVIVDKNSSRLAMTIHFESQPRMMLRGVQFSPAYLIEGTTPDLRDWSDLKSLARTIAAKTHSPGMGIAVLRNGVMKVATTGVRKLNGHDAVQSDDVWSVGSIGKSICSSVIGRLIEQGRLKWDETLKEALPSVRMDSGYDLVTLEQIMHHRGGIPEDQGFTMEDVKRIVGTSKTPISIREKYVGDILSRKPIAPRGSMFAYSNAGYALLSHVAEVASGKPYEQLVRDLVFKPLGLSHSFTGADSLPPGRPIGHFAGPKGLVAGDMKGPLESMFAGAGGGMFMSVGDLATFGQAHLLGLHGKDGFLKAATIERLHRGIPEQSPNGRLYACGWGIEKIAGIEAFHGHNGSNGTMRSQLAIFPEANLVVVGIVNRGGEDDPSAGLQAVMAVAEKFAPRK